MGARYTLRLYKGGTRENFRRHLEEAARQIGGSIAWDHEAGGNRDLRLKSNESVHSVYIPYQWTDSALCRRVGELSQLPWIELRIQEGSLWDYTLFRGAEMLDVFSVCPQYWEGSGVSEESLETQRGQPHMLAAEWEIAVERIERYIVNWGYEDDPNDPDVFHFTRTGFAYPADRHPYGDHEQFFDVLHALGAVEPTERHRIVLPSREEYLELQNNS